jgi:hypothetical protein
LKENFQTSAWYVRFTDLVIRWVILPQEKLRFINVRRQGMIKLYTSKDMLETGLIVASPDKHIIDDTEGYFCTLEDLREFAHVLFVNYLRYGTRMSEQEIFDQWLASKGQNEKAE